MIPATVIGRHRNMRAASIVLCALMLLGGACTQDPATAADAGPSTAADAGEATVDAAPGELADAQSGLNPTATDPTIVDDGAPFELVHASLSKEEFLQANWPELQRMVVRIDAELAAAYTPHRPLTTADLVLVLYAEMAIEGGNVDIDATHSLGERGLLPLPSNIAYWIGSGAPASDVLHSVEDNVYAFLRYLGQVKNKSVGEVSGRTLYRDLFLHPGIEGQFLPEAKLVAGIIHGYFYAGAYEEGAEVPFDHILAGLAAGDTLRDILTGTGYKNATPSRIYILDGRQTNLDAAAVIWRELTGL